MRSRLLARGAFGALSIAAMAAFIILWFAWRSLENYFSFARVFAMAGDALVAGLGVEANAAPPIAAA